MSPERVDRVHVNVVMAFLLLLHAACAGVERPDASNLGNRLRVRIEGREIASILTTSYIVHFAVIRPNGERVAMRIRAPGSASSEDLALIVGSEIRSQCDCDALEIAPSLHGKRDLVADVVLPEGYRLDFTPGSHLVYPAGEGRTSAAETAPELRLGQISADASHYVELPIAADP